MSSSRALKKCKYVLYIINAPPVLREEILSAASQTIITLICEIVLNIVEGNLEGGDFAEKYRAECKYLLRKTQSVKKKRAAIVDCGNQFYLDLASVLVKYA
jgi:hypothetical protein